MTYINNMPENYRFLQPLVLGNKPEGEIRKRKIIRPRKPKKKEPVFDFTYPEESFQIDINNDELLIPTDPKRKVPARIIHDVVE